MSEAENLLLKLLKERAFAQGQEFQLASGDVSHYYIDGKMVEVFSPGAHLIGEVIYERTKNLPIDAIGGLEAGAIPLTTSAVISYYHHGREMEGFWVRDEAKKHGTEKLIEGNLKRGSRLVIVDDVVTKGNSVIKAVTAARGIGCKIVLVLAVVDRLRGAEELFRQQGIEDYQPIFTIRDLGVEPNARGTAEVTSF
ncbi:MAG TPA: orotate phosphoribosyltransferase [Gemmataceae bacterium]|jgi:orotate phosphoribosyltransferase|nr:orotate phosphoribosyltransferase [Gemmataceae bacterium]